MDRRAAWMGTAVAGAALACMPVLFAVGLVQGTIDVPAAWIEFAASAALLVGAGLGVLGRPRWLASASIALTSAIWFLAVAGTEPRCSEACEGGGWRLGVLTVGTMFWPPLVAGALLGGLTAYFIDDARRRRDDGVRRP